MEGYKHVFENVKHKDIFEFVPLGDAHIGCKGAAEGHLKRYVDYIAKTPNCYWWDMGDPCDFINYSDPRFDPADLADWVNVEDLANLHYEQAERYLLLTRKIHDKCLFRLAGNHDDSVKRYYHFDIASYVSGKMQVPLLGYAAMVAIVWRRKGEGTSAQRTLFVHHGWGGGRKTGGKLNKIVDFCVGHHADAYFMGHVHDTWVGKKSRLELGKHNPPRVISRDICFALTSTFLKDAEYSKRMGYDPSFVGAIKYTVKPLAQTGLRNARRFHVIHDVGTLTL